MPFRPFSQRIFPTLPEIQIKIVLETTRGTVPMRYHPLPVLAQVVGTASESVSSGAVAVLVGASSAR
jgi:hypothetical protein